MVTDSSGLPLVSAVDLVSEAQQVRHILATDADGLVIVRRLPFGAYRVAVTRDGFASFTGLVEIRSALPTDVRVTMTLAAVPAQVSFVSAHVHGTAPLRRPRHGSRRVRGAAIES